MPSPDPPALARLTEICLALPEAARADSGRHATFTIRKRTFAYHLDDHQGDGVLGVAFKAAPGAAEPLIAANPARFYPPAYLWHRGWLGIRLDVDPIDWDEVEHFVTESYVLVAPKRLAALVTAERDA